jgi:hypothetical protein
MCKIMGRKHAFVLFCLLSILALCLSLPGLLAKDAKLKAEDVVAKHLASIGTPEAREAVQNRVVSGTVRMIHQQGGTGQFLGLINIISEDQKVRLGMNFETLTYYSDQFAFDGDKVAVDQFRPGERSTLSKFFYDHDVIIKEGLLGGILSTAWPLLDLTARQAKLDYTGLKTIEGKKLHEVKYSAKKGGGDLQIYLYFDPENFRHVRTRYRLEKPDAALSGTMSGQGREMTIYTLLEQFDNFGAIDGLTLPQMYMLQLNIQGQSDTILHDWDAKISQIMQNQQIDPKYFTIHY